MTKHWLEALGSFFIVGLGQIVKGEGQKGLLLILAFYFALPGLVFATLALNGWLFLFSFALAIILAIIIWAYNVLDALLR